MAELIKDIEETLIDELKDKGIEIKVVPRFIKDVAYALQVDPSVSLSDVNDRLHFLGWQGVDLDYHTLQLAIATYERDQSHPTQ